MFLTLLLAGLSLVDAGRVPYKRLRSSAWGYPGINATFDYVIVGGGTAGLTVASRLAEIASVAVIEAGGFHDQDNGNLSVVPFYAPTQPFLSADPSASLPQRLYDWDLTTVPQPNANGRRIHYAQAKSLGGGSTHNIMVYHRSTRGYQEHWAAAVGDSAYSWDKFFRFFKRSCTLTAPDWRKRNMPNATFQFDPHVCSDDRTGPIQVSWGNYADPALTWMLRTYEGLGVKVSKIGFSSGILAGFSGWFPATVSPTTAHRSPATEYLDRAIKETDIMVYHHTQALKINFDGDKRARSVRVSTEGVEYTIQATKEIIVSAGAFFSPQLLMVSGIGPAAHLAAHNIPVVADRPGVGQNLQDHLLFRTSRGISIPAAGAILSNPANTVSVLRQYLNDQSGPLSTLNRVISFEKLPSFARAALSARTRTLLDTLPADQPDLEYSGAANFDPSTNSTTGTITVVLLNPFSRGSVTLSSPSMADPPVIDVAWLSDTADQELLVAALKRARQAWASRGVQSVLVGDELGPGAHVATDEELLNYIRSTVSPIWHPSSTCIMGLANDSNAVVDGQGRVYGVKRLRVVDMSVLPRNVPGHPQATVYALGEKIAEDILRGR